MFALVNKSDNSITKFFNGNKGITVDGIKHSQAIFTLSLIHI